MPPAAGVENSSPPLTAMLTAPKVVTAAGVAQNDLCMRVCTAAAMALYGIADHVYRDMLEGDLGQAFPPLV